MKKKLLNLRKILNRYDPIGVYHGKRINFNEYDLEIEYIIKEFNKSKNKKDFNNKVYRIFTKSFGKEIAGKKEKYITLSNKLYLFLSKDSIKND